MKLFAHSVTLVIPTHHLRWAVATLEMTPSAFAWRKWGKFLVFRKINFLAGLKIFFFLFFIHCYELQSKTV